MKFILSKRLKFYTKEALKILNVTLIAFGFIIAIVLTKYKPIYEVKISGEEVGYVKNINAFEEKIEKDIENYSAKNIDNVEITENPEYELKLVERKQETNETEIITALQKNLKITYKYYEIALDGKTIANVNSEEEAQKIINEINKDNLTINEKVTENIEEVKTDSFEIAKSNVLKETGTTSVEENSIANINGIKIATLPITGTISSRYGVSSSIRSSRHTGLDIAAQKGTPIKAIAEGTVIFASTSGSYGNLVKIDHGNGIESWYGHTSKMYVTVGQKVNAGDIIAAVGSTGNSTGPHLHLEIRINGQHVNPQNYLYK